MALNHDTRRFQPLVAGLTDKTEIDAKIEAKKAEINAQVENHHLNHQMHRQRNLAVLRGPLEEFEEANGAV